jgi:hypothetical protein
VNRTLSPAVLTVLAISILTAPKSTVMATNGVLGVLQAYPEHGHSGDAIFLSGYGLPTKKQLTILMACPNWFAPHVWDYGNAQLQIGPQTDAAGSFTRFPLRPFHLNVLPSEGCTIYTSDQEHTFGPDIPAQYSIEPDEQALNPCDVRICARAIARPTKVRAGLYETVTIYGGQARHVQAAGARADVVVNVPGMKPIKKTLYLGIFGTHAFRFQVGQGVKALTRATIQVRCRLGPYQGVAHTDFMVMR